MIVLGILLFCLLLLLLTGIVVSKCMRISNEFLNKNGILLMPGIGVLFLINAVQLFNLLLPVKYFVIPYLLFMVWGIRKYFTDVLRYMQTLWKGKLFLILIFCFACIYAVPLIVKGELCSVQTWNNDIMYYLSTMDWLHDHNSLEQVIYSSESPYFWCADYMLGRTRIGFDGFGAFMMSLLQLQAYQIFSLLGVLFGIVLLFHTYYVAGSVFQLPKMARIILLIVVASAGHFEELFVYQYLPQIGGIAFLLLFIGLVIQIVENESFPPFLTALVIAGSIALYAEFSAYLFVIYVGVAIMTVVKRKDADRLLFMIKEGLLALLINPAGAFRACKLNLFVLINSGDDMSKIDPFAGAVLRPLEAVAKSVGLFMVEKTNQAVWVLNCILLLLCVSVIIGLWSWYALKCKDEKKPYLFLSMSFFVLYELYFRIIGYGYGEYKHLISLTPIILVVQGYIVFMVMKECKELRILQITTAAICLLLITAGIGRLGEFYKISELYYFDESVEQLAEAGRQIDARETISIGGSPAGIHGAVYGLRNRDVCILANQISYYPFSQEAAGKYRLYELDKEERVVSANEEILWDNNRFYLVKNTGLQSGFYGGFHGEEIKEEESIRYTCDKESSIYVYNFSEETKYFALKFQTATVGEKPSHIKIMANGKVLEQGMTGDFFVTNPISLEAGEKVRIFLYDQGQLVKVEGRDVGYILKDYSLIEYEQEDMKKYENEGW